MKLIFSLLVLVTATQAHARTDWHADCGISDSYDDSYTDLTEQKKVDHQETYTKLEMQQIVITAKRFAGDDQSTVPVTSLKTAIDSLSENSEAGDVYIFDQESKGKALTTVVYYPGGNPVGLLFLKGTTIAVAEIQDSSVACIVKD